MATPECNESDSSSIAPCEAKKPESVPFSNQMRSLTVGAYVPPPRHPRPLVPIRMRRFQHGPYPRLLLQGKWLELAGFEIGAPVTVSVHQGCLIVQMDSEADADEDAECPPDPEPTPVPDRLGESIFPPSLDFPLHSDSVHDPNRSGPEG